MPSAGRETVHVEVDGERRLISRSPALQRVFRQIQQVATADVSVLTTGETATGKELVARLVHKLSHRASREFVAVDCNAVAPTLNAAPSPAPTVSGWASSSWRTQPPFSWTRSRTWPSR